MTKYYVNTDKLIGPARRVAEALGAKIARIKSGQDTEADPLLLWGPPGTGKTTVGWILARQWAGHELAIEHINGQEMTVDKVREWRRNSCFKPMWGDCQVRFVDEINAASPAAQGELRTYLDDLHPYLGFIATTNRSPEQLDESIQTRFYDREVTGANDNDLMVHLTDYGIPRPVAARIIDCVKGNVRCARIEARKWKDSQR